MADNKNATAQTDMSAWIEGVIKEFCQKSPENSLKNQENEPATYDPLVGFSSGADPLYAFLKKDIGPQKTPIEIFQKSFPGESVTPQELTVISYILPATRLTKDDNSKETKHPSERWARTKHFGGLFGSKLSEHLVETLKNAGYEAIAPYAQFGDVSISGRYWLASAWSERHAAYVSGLGTFGLCDGLITERGKAMHCFSVIAKIQIPPTPRPYKNHHDYCLYYADGSCSACIKRCPAGAISTKGHNKSRCMQYCFGPALQYIRNNFGIDDYGCGLCQTGVPCESRNPMSGR